MSNTNREYWDKMVEEFEEVVASEIDGGYYDESKIPDLEDLANQCPYRDLVNRLTMYAVDIECHMIEHDIEKVEVEDNYLEFCFDF